MSAVAVIQTAFIGDVVLATPLLESARSSRPGDTIIAVVRAGCENIRETVRMRMRSSSGTKRADAGISGLAAFSKPPRPSGDTVSFRTVSPYALAAFSQASP